MAGCDESRESLLRSDGGPKLCLANIPTVRDSPTQSFAIGDQTMRLEHP